MPSDQDESPENTLPDVRDGQDLSELLARLGESKRPSPIGLSGAASEGPPEKVRLALLDAFCPESAHDERIDILGTAESEMATRAGHPGARPLKDLERPPLLTVARLAREPRGALRAHIGESAWVLLQVRSPLSNPDFALVLPR